MQLSFPEILTQEPDRISIQEVFRDFPSSALLPLKFGELSLRAFSLTDTGLLAETTRDDPHILHLKSANVSSESGIVSLNGNIIKDTLIHTSPEKDGYQIDDNGKVLLPAPTAQLSETWLSLLLGNNDNYFHFLIMNIARLCLLSAEKAKKINGILLPQTITPAQCEITELALSKAFSSKLPKNYTIENSKSITVEKLLLPWNILSHLMPYKGALLFLRSLYTFQNTLKNSASRKIYIDRSHSPVRPLVNETELISELLLRDFEIIQMEKLSFIEQITYFFQASLIVAPHGAGLTNIIYCSPNTQIIEI
ncbi:glycosyltransferase family 61 protein [Entomobacter blattae]|uniref:Glycosyltransferase 61 catalytic domain-containing protein n=1 Tax=Entomobacter blattae TaxID=2762277 RepID=A0A7H1NRN6_9PROT|nr:glycosyltransferase family 61 protein [Entomobacter blattae]QNT78446.1 hypothetical protein JGUZn3_12200 [Entomobacter blattae]